MPHDPLQDPAKLCDYLERNQGGLLAAALMILCQLTDRVISAFTARELLGQVRVVTAHGVIESFFRHADGQHVATRVHPDGFVEQHDGNVYRIDVQFAHILAVYVASQNKPRQGFPYTLGQIRYIACDGQFRKVTEAEVSAAQRAKAEPRAQPVPCCLLGV